MKQYKLTAADFVSPGESLVPDAILSPEDKAALGIRDPDAPKMSDFLKQQIELRKSQVIEAVDIVIEEKKNF